MRKKISKHIAVYSGSFNPVHIGHVQLAEYLTVGGLADEVWFVVSPKNPLKEQADLLDEHLRMKMLTLAIRANKRLTASDIEFNMPIPSYTIATLQTLEKNYPQHHFSLIIGSDNALVFDRWKDYRTILQHFPVWVYPRRTYDFGEVADTYPQMKLVDTPYYDVSSTQIRQLLKEKKDAGPYLHPDVYRFILKNELYLTK
ncbi:MAG: nicotinate-nucleotide adenylyltransferase [Prevotellaceae bacterium]|jgi:nicotinate-nucleotide adenylyltransferase|nr:nicotinate-nucleotide adenylyltransferase [Prevotellaceae bacterium]